MKRCYPTRQPIIYYDPIELHFFSIILFFFWLHSRHPTPHSLGSFWPCSMLDAGGVKTQ